MSNTEKELYEQLAESNPFMSRSGYARGPRWLQCVVAEDRIKMVREFDAEQCRQVIALPGVQLTVKHAAEARLRRLNSKSAIRNSQ